MTGTKWMTVSVHIVWEISGARLDDVYTRSAVQIAPQTNAASAT